MRFDFTLLVWMRETPSKQNFAKEKTTMLTKKQLLAAPAVLGLLVTVSPLMAGTDDDGSFTFNMVVSGGAKACLPNATASVRITPAGPVETMDVTVQGLPPNTDFDFFVIQVPKSPFEIRRASCRESV